MMQREDTSALESASADASMNESVSKSANECPECGKAYKSKQTLKLHLDVEHYGKRLSCQQCSKEFKYAHQLKLHVKKKHGDEEQGSTINNC